jgi:transposase
MATDSEVSLTRDQHSELNSIAQSRSLPAGYVFRARLILMLAEGASFNTIKRRLQTSAPTIIRWKQRFLQSGLDGLDTYDPGQRATVLTPALRARILSATRKKPGDGSTHWSCRKLATALGVSKDAVHRVWKEAGLKPHRLERYLASDDPEFEPKAADILGLYLNPPQHAAVFCVDEKTAIQALDRLDPVLPLSRDAPSATGLSTTVTERFRSMPRWTPRPAASMEEPQPATPVATSLSSWKKWCPCARPGSRFISSSTTSPPIKLNWFATSCNAIRGCSFTSRLPILPGSTKSRSGSPKSSVRSSPAPSSPRYQT